MQIATIVLSIAAALYALFGLFLTVRKSFTPELDDKRVSLVLWLVLWVAVIVCIVAAEQFGHLNAFMRTWGIIVSLIVYGMYPVDHYSKGLDVDTFYKRTKKPKTPADRLKKFADYENRR